MGRKRGRRFGASFAAAFIAVVALAGLSCGDSPAPGVSGVKTQTLLDAGAGVKQVAWVGDWLVVQRFDRTVLDGSSWTSRLFAVAVGGSTLREVPVPYNNHCGENARYAIEGPMRVEGNIVAYLQRCAPIGKDGNTAPGHSGLLLLYDLSTMKSVALLDGRDVSPRVPQTLPDSEVDGIGLDLGHGRLWVPAEERGRLVDLLETSLGNPIQRPELPFVQLWGMAASQDKSRVAFAARKDKDGPIGTGPATLYIAPFERLDEAQAVLDLDSGGLLGSGWSFDGRWIAFLATIGGKRGLHVLNTETREVRFIVEGSYHPNASSWSPTDLRIALIEEGDLQHGILKIFDLREALGDR